MSLGQLKLELRLDGNDFTIGLKSAEGALGAFILGTNRANASLHRTESAFKSLGGKIKDMIISLALVRDAFRTIADATYGWQKSIIDVNADMQKSIQLMKSFSKETDPIRETADAMADVNMLMDKASKAPFSLKAMTDSFVKLRVAGLDNATAGFNALVDSVAQFGGDDEAIKRASVAIQQMAGKGVVSMEELRQQLGEAVPTAIQQMANGLGVTYSKLVKEISQGKVKSEPAIVAMFREMELSSSGAAMRMMNTWSGATAQLDTEFKKLLLTVGGFEDGYGDGTYMGGMTNSIKELTQLLKDPSIQQSAAAFGKNLTAIMNAAMGGIKWISQYRSEIYELGKAFLTIYAATKAVSIISSVGTAVMSLVSQMTGAAGSVRTSWAAINSGFANFGTGISAMRTGSTAASGALTAVRGLLGAVGGAAALATGPIGILAAAVAAGAYSWWEYKKAAQAGIQAMIDAKGQGAGLKEVMDAQDKVTKNAQDIANLERDNRIANGTEKGAVGFLSKLSSQYIDVVSNNKKIAELQRESSQLNDAIAVGQANMIKQRANIEFEAARSSIADGMGKVGKEYEASMKTYQDRIAAGEKSGKDKDPTYVKESQSMKLGIERAKLEKEAGLYQAQLDKINKEITDKQEMTKGGVAIPIDDKAIAAKKQAANQVLIALGEVGQKQEDLLKNSKTMSDTVLSGTGKDAKPKFDALSIWVDKLAVKYGNLSAKAEEANPYLGELTAVVDSLDGKKLPNFDAEYAKAKKLAEGYWEAEKAMKAIKDAGTEYKNGLSRIDAIQDLVSAKLAKVEELNPWEKASADASRYEDEMADLSLKLEDVKKKAYDANKNGKSKSLLEELDGQGVALNARMEEVQKTLDRLKVSDVAKKMTQDSRSINEGLMENADQVKSEYNRQTKWAEDFYNKHKEQLDQDAGAMAAYWDYRASLDAKYARDTESGLDAWIRQNKDATDEYKSLWGSAMDKFNDTLVDGLTSGKFELSAFVEYVLKEFLKIQLAKQMASAAEAIGGSNGTGGLLGTIATGIGSFLGSGSTSAAGTGATAGDYSSDAFKSWSASQSKFANGGVMTEYGELALRKYANGGIAKTPQVAIYGEGSGAEAYVPLPDGRSIPVTMSNSNNSQMSTAKTAPVPVEVNLYNQGGDKQEATSTSQFDGEKMIVDVVLKNLSRPGPVRDAVKGAK